jgi:hypothetical protein
MIGSLAALTSQRLLDAGIEFTADEAGSVRITGRNSAVGDIVVSFDGNEVSVFLGDITHCHFTPYKADDNFPGCTPEQAATDAVSFIREVIADQWIIWRWSDGRGGCYKPGADDDAADGPLPGELVEYFVWSGPYVPPGKAPTGARES